MSAFHVFYIPAMIGLGVLFGMLLGRRNTLLEIAARQRAEREREARRQSRLRSEAEEGEEPG